MKIKRSLFQLGMLGGASAQVALGSISFDLQVDGLQSASGAAFPADGIVVLLADTAGNDFQTVVPTELGTSSGMVVGAGMTLDGVAGDDLVLWFDDLSNNGIDGLLAHYISNVELGTHGSTFLGEGNSLGLAWFPEASLAAGSIVEGSAYGFFSLGLGSLGSDWSVPADGTSSHSLYAFAETSQLLPYGAGSGDLVTSLFVADRIVRAAVEVIPEPATMVPLGLFGLMVALAVRRRQA